MFQCYFNDTVFGKIIFSDISHHITYRSRERGGVMVLHTVVGSGVV